MASARACSGPIRPAPTTKLRTLRGGASAALGNAVSQGSFILLNHGCGTSTNARELVDEPGTPMLPTMAPASLIAKT